MITSDEFSKIYKKEKFDESITPLQRDVGFSILRRYDSKSEFDKNNKRMLIYIILDKDSYLSGGIDMVDAEVKENGYRTITNQKFKKRYTNFNFGQEEDIKYNTKNKAVIWNNTTHTLNSLVRIIVNNHNSDRLFWKRQLNRMINKLLSFIFWLVGKKYEYFRVMLRLQDDDQKISKDSTLNNFDPVFKFFKIPKNMLILTLFTLFILSILYDIFGFLLPFSISKETVWLFSFLMLFNANLLAEYLLKKIDGFYRLEKNFIFKLAKLENNYSFKMKLKI